LLSKQVLFYNDIKKISYHPI